MEDYFGKTLFSHGDLEYIREIVNDNMSCLFELEEFIINDDKLENSKIKLLSLFNSELEEKEFAKHEQLVSNSIEWQNCLAYYLGVSRGLELKKIKK